MRSSRMERLPGMLILLLLLAFGFALNLYLLERGSSGNSQVWHTSKLINHAESMAADLAQVAAGDIATASELEADREAFEKQLRSFQKNSDKSSRVQAKLSRVASLWRDVSLGIDGILQKELPTTSLKDANLDVHINFQLVQQENHQVVRRLARIEAKPNEIVAAQRQMLLIERMSHTLDKVVDRGYEQTLEDQFNRDRQAFQGVLRGFREGNSDLFLAAATDREVVAGLKRVAELFPVANSGAEEVLMQASHLAGMKGLVVAVESVIAELLKSIDDLMRPTSAVDIGQQVASVQVAWGLGGAMLVTLLLTLMALIRRAFGSEVREVQPLVRKTRYSREQIGAARELDDMLEEINAMADRSNILAINAAIQASTSSDENRNLEVLAEELDRFAPSLRVIARQISDLVRTIKKGSS